MARGKVVYVLFYDNNEPGEVSRFSRSRCQVFNSFWRAHEELGRDIDYWYSRGGHIQNEWYNDANISDATACKITMYMPDGSLMNCNIVPSSII